MFPFMYTVIAVCVLVDLSGADRYIRTSATEDTKTTYIGQAYTTVFDSKILTTAKFLGIPFAVPPVRFEKSVLDIPKDEVFNATQFGNVCPQSADNIGYSGTCNFPISEDCLYLNIYIPLSSFKTDDLNVSSNEQLFLNINSTSAKYAVLIYIHGGAFVSGNGNCYDGSILAGFGNIIVVTINHRLGNLGFLSTNDDVIPRNLGLWDQHVAIQWVNNNIHVFGGDTTRITVGGQSSGSFSAIYQALYPGNDKLFQRLIAQSGTPATVKSATTTRYNSTLELANDLDCCTSCTTQEIKACLMNKTAEEIVNVHLSLIVPASLPIQPTVDGSLVVEDPYYFLSKMATSIATTKSTVPLNFISKDMLIGVNSQDGDVVLKFFIAAFSRGDNELYEENLRSIIISPGLFRELIRLYFLKSYEDVVDENIINAIMDRYIDWGKPTDYNLLSNRAIDILTDVIFTMPSLDTASAHIQVTEDPSTKPEQSTQAANGGSNQTANNTTQGNTFVYRFSAPENNNSVIPWFIGTGHAAEVIYFFGAYMLQDVNDIKLAKTFMTYWSNFVKSGDPNTDYPKTQASSQFPVWPEYNNIDEQYMELSVNPLSEKHMRTNYRHFWTDYIPKLNYYLNKVREDGLKKNGACATNNNNDQTNNNNNQTNNNNNQTNNNNNQTNNNNDQTNNNNNQTNNNNNQTNNNNNQTKRNNGQTVMRQTFFDVFILSTLTVVFSGIYKQQ